MATKLAIEKYGDAVEIYYNDTGSEHPDNARFMADCEKWFGQPVNVLRSEKFANIWEVFEARRFLVSNKGAPCTSEMKRIPGESVWSVGDVEIFGYTADEAHRLARFRGDNTERIIECPLIDKHLTKEDCLGMLERVGIEIPAMYRLGFRNNNCIGCVKARDSLDYWKRVRKHFPAVFERTALSREDTLALLDRVKDQAGYPTKLIARMLYGCGLRVSEPLNLRIKDVDLRGSRLVIRGAKGGKDRVVTVPCSIMPEIEEQINRARVVWQADQHRRMPVEVPGELARKYKNAPFSWQWAWLFPAHQSCNHPRTGERVRYRMHEANVQRAVKEAAKSLDLDSLATPHVFRHCWATHVIDAGASIRDVQERMGHASLETTMGYIQPDPRRIPSLI